MLRERERERKRVCLRMSDSREIQTYVQTWKQNVYKRRYRIGKKNGNALILKEKTSNMRFKIKKRRKVST